MTSAKEFIKRAALLLTGMSCASAALADPPQRGQWQPIPALTDEFNGDSLDVTKWHDHNPKWGGRQPAWFSQKNVEVRDGELRLTAKLEALSDLPAGYHTYTTAAVKSRTRVLYGYFEARCKPMKSSLDSGFWFYDDEPNLWTEIDVFEMAPGLAGFERRYMTNAHVFRTPQRPGTADEQFSQIWLAPYALADEYHVYGLEWDEKEIRWYVDGNLIRALENSRWHQPLYLNFDSEIMADWLGLPDSRDLPSTFHVDYVRSWRKIGQPQPPPGAALPATQVQKADRHIRGQIARGLLLVAGAIFILLGLAHGSFALRDRGKQPGMCPQGIELGHGLGLIAYGLTLVAFGGPLIVAFVFMPTVQAALTIIAAAYFALSWRFRLANAMIGSAVGLTCIVGAVLSCAFWLIPA